jgi:hypothetical protein
MIEPASSTASATYTLVMGATSVSALTAFGVPLGLRVDVLMAGFMGALVAIVLLNTVPSTGDTARELFKTTFRRAFVCLASAAVAGYLVPWLLDDALQAKVTATSFIVGAGAQKILAYAIERFSKPVATPPAGEGSP